MDGFAPHVKSLCAHQACGVVEGVLTIWSLSVDLPVISEIMCAHLAYSLVQSEQPLHIGSWLLVEHVKNGRTFKKLFPRFSKLKNVLYIQT